MENPKEAIDQETMRLDKIELIQQKRKEERNNRLASFANFIKTQLSQA